MNFNFDGSSGSSERHNPRQKASIRQWVVELFNLHEEITVMVTELKCLEEGCPPVETVIAILDAPGSTRQYKVHKPVMDIEYEDVVSLAKKPAERHDNC